MRERKRERGRVKEREGGRERERDRATEDPSSPTHTQRPLLTHGGQVRVRERVSESERESE